MILIILIALLIDIISIFYSTSYLSSVDCINLEAINNISSNENPNSIPTNPSNIYYIDPIKDKNSIFNIFIDLFNISNSNYKYFPSYFVPTRFDYHVEANSYNLSEIIAYYEHDILNQN